MLRASIVVLLAALTGCSSSPAMVGVDGSAPPDAAAPPTADWILAIDPSAPPGGRLDPALLGHYDLSGALFQYRRVPGLAAKLQTAGFREQRIGLGRWESATRLLPALTDGSSCQAELAGLPPEAFAPNGATDLDLISSRDWFSDDGQPVTAAATLDDRRYALGYLRAAIDDAAALGARPYIGIDTMPRALALSRTPSRTRAALAQACQWTWTNRVSNVPPADPAVFAAAVVGVVQRIVLGSGGEPGRDTRSWEVWNEPELPYAWDPSFDNANHDRFFQMAILTLQRLDAWRAGQSSPAAKQQRFGLGSFANAGTAAGVIAAFDQAATNGTKIPIDFVSFHSYSNDPLAIIADVELVIAARAKSVHYRDVELVLSEWGPSLTSTVDPRTMEAPLLVAAVLARAASAGLGRSHHTFFYDFYSVIPWGLIDHAGNPKPLYGAYQLLAPLVSEGADRLPIAGLPDGNLDGGAGAAIASRDGAGVLRVLVVNRGSTSRTVRLDVSGAPAAPTNVQLFDDPKSPPRLVTPSLVVQIPARSIGLLTR